VKDIIVTATPKTIESTKLRVAAPAASAVRGFGATGFAAFAFEANFVPATMPITTIT
jgi:hypothetical protein